LEAKIKQGTPNAEAFEDSPGQTIRDLKIESGGDQWFLRESQRAQEAKEKMKTAHSKKRRSSQASMQNSQQSEGAAGRHRIETYTEDRARTKI